MKQFSMVKQWGVTIIGAGPAGLTAAYELTKKGVSPLVLERGDKVGGIARTEVYRGYRFDIGGHRFFTKVLEIENLWKEVLGDQFIRVPRLSRIYYRGKFFDYPLSFRSTLGNLGAFDSALILWSYLKAKFQFFVKPHDPQTFEEWVIHCFGERLYQTFFKTYTEKVWGIPCDQITAEWAKQRIKGMSLKAAVLNLLSGQSQAKSLIKAFDYPLLGPGMMWEAFQESIVQSGGEVRLNTEVIRLERTEHHLERVIVASDGSEKEVRSEQYISSMPITSLVRCLAPLPPQEVLAAAQALSYRDFLIVALIINAEELFPDNWIYIHDAKFQVGRIQNFKNWSPAMVPDLTKTCLGMKYFCSQGDPLWSLSESELLDLAAQEELEGLGLAKASLVEDGTVIRQKKAYPVYDHNYTQHLAVIRSYLANFDNLQTVGRNGQHRYNNQDHSMLTGWLAAKNLLGESHCLWEVNLDRSYYEGFTQEEWRKRQKI